MKQYEGIRNGAVADVIVDGKPLNPRRDLWNRSPSGFEWGYGGSGPGQLALALLADCLGDDEEALSMHNEFACEVVAGLPYKGWILSEEEIHDAVQALEDSQRGSIRDLGKSQQPLR